MAGEVYAFANKCDEAYVMKDDLERIYRQHVPLVMLTDSRQRFDFMKRASHRTKKRLMIDIAAVHEAYNSEQISNVGLLYAKRSAADVLTEQRPCAALQVEPRACMDSNPVQQWIIRPAAAPRRSMEEQRGCDGLSLRR